MFPLISVSSHFSFIIQFLTSICLLLSKKKKLAETDLISFTLGKIQIFRFIFFGWNLPVTLQMTNLFLHIFSHIYEIVMLFIFVWPDFTNHRNFKLFWYIILISFLDFIYSLAKLSLFVTVCLSVCTSAGTHWESTDSLGRASSLKVRTPEVWKVDGTAAAPGLNRRSVSSQDDPSLLLGI